jgi:hypothetical protein
MAVLAAMQFFPVRRGNKMEVVKPILAAIGRAKGLVFFVDSLFCDSL